MSKHVEVTYVAFAETYSQMVWLGCKHTKRGRMKTRVETYMKRRWWRVLHTCYRVQTLTVGKEKPVLALNKSSRVGCVMSGLEHCWRQRQGDEDAEIFGVRDGASPNQGSGRRRGSGVSEEICLQRRPAWDSSVVSVYK